MKRLRQYHRLSRVFLILALLSLMFQVESAFACNMMDHDGATQFCCCTDGGAADREPVERDYGRDGRGHPGSFSECCTFSDTLTLKGGGLDEPAPLLLAELTAPQALALSALVFIPAQLWAFSDTTSHTAFAPPAGIHGSVRGNETYLITQRLRI